MAGQERSYTDRHGREEESGKLKVESGSRDSGVRIRESGDLKAEGRKSEFRKMKAESRKLKAERGIQEGGLPRRGDTLGRAGIKAES